MADTILAAPLTDHEAAVLEALAARHNISADTSYLHFGMIEERTGLDRGQVRDASRALAARGLAQFSRGLWTDDGTPGGSGYAITEVGHLVAEARRARAAAAQEA